MESAFHYAYSLIRHRLDTQSGRMIAGICGAQGSGKSTLTKSLADRLRNEKIQAEILSIDDLYFTRRQRRRLAEQVHPLLATRGVPGTHDISLGLRIISSLSAGHQVTMPRFDKAIDDRMPVEHWPLANEACRVLLFEGWCVGARAQTNEELIDPVNELERLEDADGRWRRFVNEALAGDYQRLFVKLDCLLMLAAPSFEIVRDWRSEQEQGLRRSNLPSAPGLLEDSEVARFVQHYERLTRHMLVEMPGRADLTIELSEDRSVRAVRSRAPICLSA